VQDVEEIILVDAEDREIGRAEKLEAHRDGGRLHRAFSVFLFDRAGFMLLQRRSRQKYHFGGLWTNACCGHPRPGEDVAFAARRRVREELGIEADVREVLSFTYSARDARSGLIEREFDHVFVGHFDGETRPDPAEVEDLRWLEPAAAQRDAAARPEHYTPWFATALAHLENAGALPGSGRG
jgi:isopentenyl-diphosphate delta-isomerase